ncbi:hypothetical protein AVEN_15453-1 [Araneus ventricosus]|uniref:Histone-lysine N-methyltransferase SETMAR n=1 Tax=Araneus ventricosus TaxID=182803 RepID=A0A4Y2ED00_ARAVE|nr:hypothetical protein AVEN_15453-1 [Araneus ventricosus]
MLPPSVTCVVIFAFFKQKVGLWKTINATVSCQTLRRLRRGSLTSGVLIPDNARTPNAVVTQQLLKQFKWDMSNRTAYSPDLATRDFHLFLELKNWLGGQRLQKKDLKVVLNHLTSHHWRQRSSKRGFETWATDIKNV